MVGAEPKIVESGESVLEACEDSVPEGVEVELKEESDDCVE